MDNIKETQPQQIGTLVDGVGASEALDSSGERLDIKGVDLSTVDAGKAMVNWEHDSKSASSIIGKVLSAKKIFEEKDCANDRELYFWNKVQLPFIYVVCELFDAVGHDQAKEVAAMLRYDEAKKGDGKPPVVNFSIEGSKVAKNEQTGVVTHSIAKKFSITTGPCNHTAIAEIYKPEAAKAEKSSNKKFDTLFKSEIPVELIKNVPVSSMRAAPIAKAKIPAVVRFPGGKNTGIVDDRQIPGREASLLLPQNALGKEIGKTRNGHPVLSQAKPGNYKGFTSEDHTDAMNAHYNMGLASTNPKEKNHHLNMAKWHSMARERAERNEAQMQGAYAIKKSGDAAPSTLTGTLALQKEKLKKDDSEKYQAKAYDSIHHLTGEGEEILLDHKTHEPIARFWNGNLVSSGKLNDGNTKDTEPMAKGKNAKEQKARVWGTTSQPSAGSEMREHHSAHIKDFTRRRYGLEMQDSGGKWDEKTQGRRSANPKVGVDKPDWRSGKIEAQNNPDAQTHEIGHLEIMPEGVNLPEGQRLMDRQYTDVQRKYGYMKQKQSQGEVQPMAAEQLLRRRMGLPANQSAVPVKPGDGPRMSVDTNELAGTRITKPSGKVVDLIRQSRFLSPENRERIDMIDRGELKYNPEKGWEQSDSLNAKINRRAREASKDPSRKDAKTLMRSEIESTFQKFEKSEEVLKIVEEKFPSMNKNEQLAIAKMFVYRKSKES